MEFGGGDLIRTCL